MVNKSKKSFTEPTKDRLKTMSHNTSGSFFRTKGRIIKYGFSGFVRHIWLSLAATVVTTFTLIILFITVIASVILSSTADYMRQKIDITVYFTPGTSDEALNSMAETMRKDPNVTSVETANSEKEYENYIAEQKLKDDEDTLSLITSDEMKDILISTMQATMRIKVLDSDNLDSIKTIVDTNDEFTANVDTTKPPTYDVNSSQIATISSWANMAKTGGLILSVIFLIVSTLVIFNTIRMAIFSRREEIYMEKLIGANNSFIRGPFLVEAELCGIIAGILSSVIGIIAYHSIAPKLADYGIHIDTVSSVLESNKVILAALVMVVLGWLINMISARLAVRKYLK